MKIPKSTNYVQMCMSVNTYLIILQTQNYLLKYLLITYYYAKGRLVSITAELPLSALPGLLTMID